MREKRLAQELLNREKKRANESSETKTIAFYESAECREKRLLNQR